MLSIAIINYKNPALLRLCISSLKRVINYDFKHEIIVVDSVAGLETTHIATEEFSDVRYLPFHKNIGYTRGVNEALKSSLGDIVLIINPDIIPLQGSIEKLYYYMHEHPEIGLLGPRLLNFDGSYQESCFRFYTPFTIVYRRTFLGKLPFVKNIIKRFLLKDKDLSRPTPVDWLMGSALMVSKKSLEKTGYMDENFFLYMSDVDWPRRFWENGYTVVFYPDAMMYHYHRRESRGALDALDALFNKQTRQHIKDALYYFKKNGLHEKSYT
jgi:GT2 family glycosyltransferase